MIHCIKLESQGIILFFPQKSNETPDFDLHLLYNDSTISMAQKHKNVPSGTESAQFIETGDVFKKFMRKTVYFLELNRESIASIYISPCLKKLNQGASLQKQVISLAFQCNCHWYL